MAMIGANSDLKTSFANAIQDFNQLSKLKTPSYHDWVYAYLLQAGLLIEKVDDPGQYVQPGSTRDEIEQYLDVYQSDPTDGYPVFQWDNYPYPATLTAYSNGGKGHVSSGIGSGSVQGWYYDSLKDFSSQEAYLVQFAFGFRRYKGLWYICQADLTPISAKQYHPPV